MKIKINVISATLIIAPAIGITAYTRSSDGDNQGRYGMGGSIYV
ncbi:MAG: hypothetical protein BMS9Abin03_275 [Thermodesulfobacteriota bacterium]|nr:MAG: hypothetical protein BMS9Abin03_275 [Thermodesulfobacteriota bacterium]